MVMPRKYSDEQLELVHAARKVGIPWDDLSSKYGPGVKQAYYARKKRKGPREVPNVWYPASYYEQHGLPSPYK